MDGPASGGSHARGKLECNYNTLYYAEKQENAVLFFVKNGIFPNFAYHFTCYNHLKIKIEKLYGCKVFRIQNFEFMHRPYRVL